MERNPAICIIGQMVGRNVGFVTTQGQVVADLFHANGYTVVCASSKKSRIGRMLDIVATVLRHRRTTDLMIVEIYSGLSFVVADAASLLAKYVGLPAVGVLHGGDLPRFCRDHPRWTSRVLRRYARLTAPSRFLAETIGKDGRSITVIPNVVDISAYPRKVRRELEPCFLWMRAFHEIYNPAMAVRVFSSIKRKYPTARLTMAGVDKGGQPKIRKMVDEAGLTGAVRFPGFLDQAAKIREFSEADIFLNTNRIDNTPVSVIEACAMGLPVVATSVGGIPDLLQTGETGLLVPNGDVEGMVSAVDELLKNQGLAERLSIKGRELAEKFSWESVRPRWVELFREIQLENKKLEFANQAVSNVTNS